MLKINKGQVPKKLQDYAHQLPKTPDEYLNPDHDRDPNISYKSFRDTEDVREALLSEQGYICAYCMQRIDKDKMKIEHWFAQSKVRALKKIVNRIKKNNQSWSEVTEKELLDISSLLFGQVVELNDEKVQELWEKIIPTELDYSNMLGCCTGDTGDKGAELTEKHCDTFRSANNKELKYNPANQEHHTLLGISYQNDGTIMSSDEEFNQQLNEVLNLNNKGLKNNRKAIINKLILMCIKKILKEQNLDKILKEQSLDEILKEQSLDEILKEQSLDEILKGQNLDEILKKFTGKDEKGQLHEYSGVASFWIEKRLRKLNH